MARFTLPRDVYFGADALRELSCLRGHKRAFVVLGAASMKQNGFFERLKGILEHAQLEVRLFEGVAPDPSVETVRKGAEQMRSFEPDVIVAMGGGAVLDAAKAMRLFYECPKLTFEDAREPLCLPRLRGKSIFVAIPSTSGSAAEVTAFSMITDYEEKTKYPIADYALVPDIAVLDPSLTSSMTPALIAFSGMEALTHAIEAYVSASHNDFTDPLALQAIGILTAYLEDFYCGSTDAGSRIHTAQCLAGMAVSNAFAGVTHALSRQAGVRYELPYGCCNAILLPYVMQYNRRVCMKRFADAARYLGLPGRSDMQLTNVFITVVQRLANALGVAPTLRDAGVPEPVFRDTLDDICAGAAQDPCMATNPRRASTEDLRSILSCAYEGRAVAF